MSSFSFRYDKVSCVSSSFDFKLLTYDVLLAYMKGGEQERFNPLTGARYDKAQTHDVNEADEQAVAALSSSNTTCPSRNGYGPNRGRNGFFEKKDGNRWKGKARANSPYQKTVKESSSKVVEVQAKAKDKP